MQIVMSIVNKICILTWILYATAHGYGISILLFIQKIANMKIYRKYIQ